MCSVVLFLFVFLTSGGWVKTRLLSSHTTLTPTYLVPDLKYTSCASVATAAQASATERVSKSTRPDPEGIRCGGDSHPGDHFLRTVWDVRNKLTHFLFPAQTLKARKRQLSTGDLAPKRLPEPASEHKSYTLFTIDNERRAETKRMLGTGIFQYTRAAAFPRVAWRGIRSILLKIYNPDEIYT